MRSLVVNGYKLRSEKDVISLVDQSASITVKLGEKVTVRIEESLKIGLLWSRPLIDGDGVTLQTSRSLMDEKTSIEYREFVFQTHRTGRTRISSSLKQAGFEKGVKQLFMVVDVVTEAESLEGR